MSFDDLLLDPIYDTLGVDIEIYGDGSDSEPIFSGRAIDKTGGVEILDSSANRRGSDRGAVSVPTVLPIMAVKSKDLQAAGLAPGDLVDRSVTLSGAQWVIVNHIPRPGIFGEPGGQVYFRMRKSFDG